MMQLVKPAATCKTQSTTHIRMHGRDFLCGISIWMIDRYSWQGGMAVCLRLYTRRHSEYYHMRLLADELPLLLEGAD